MTREWDEIKYEVAVANRVLAEVGLATGFRASLGHASLRLPNDPDKFVVKGRGYTVDALYSMRPQDMIVVDIEGHKVDGPRGSSQPFEVKMHSSIMKLRPEVNSVVHVHPHYTILATTLRKRLRPMNQEGAQLVQKELPVWEHVKTVQTEEEGLEVATLMGDSPAILLRGHGATTAGSSLENAVMTMIQLEEQAKMNYWGLLRRGGRSRLPGRRDRGRDVRPHAVAGTATLHGRAGAGLASRRRRRVAVLHAHRHEQPGGGSADIKAVTTRETREAPHETRLARIDAQRLAAYPYSQPPLCLPLHTEERYTCSPSKPTKTSRKSVRARRWAN